MSIYTLHWIRNNPDKVRFLCSRAVDRLPKTWGSREKNQFCKVLGELYFRHPVFQHYLGRNLSPREIIDQIKIWEFIQVSTSHLRDTEGIGKVKLTLVQELREYWDVELGPWHDEAVKKYFLEASTASTSQEIDNLSVTDEIVPLARVRDMQQDLIVSHSTLARMLSDLEKKSGEIDEERRMLLAKQEKIQTAMEALQKLSEDD